jgi:hypothetical protein
MGQGKAPVSHSHHPLASEGIRDVRPDRKCRFQLLYRCLDQICLGSFDLQFHFEGGRLILSVQSAIALKQGNNPETYRIGEEVPPQHLKGASSIALLLGQTVTAASGDTVGTLSLDFSSGVILQALDDDPRYEAYQISRAGHPLIVV